MTMRAGASVKLRLVKSSDEPARVHDFIDFADLEDAVETFLAWAPQPRLVALFTQIPHLASAMRAALRQYEAAVRGTP
jgi:hypothetical protein